MNEKKEDDPQWLQALQRKNAARAKRKKQVFFQKILILVLAAAVAAAAFFLVSGRGKKGEKQGADIAAAPDAAGQDVEDGKAESADLEDTKQAGQVSQDPESDAPVSQNTIADDSGSKDASLDAPASEGTDPKDADTADDGTDIPGQTEDGQQEGLAYAWTGKTRTLGNGISSSHAVLIDIENEAVLACKKEKSRIVPASMTKVLTLLTAAEHLDAADLDDKFKITVEITDYSYVNECSSAGFGIDEKVSVRDLLYGTILPSGADAALGLAMYVAGSQESFVEMMNEKLEELGLSKTAHFTNCVGIYDKDHYCTVLDMAVIMQAALENELCREVLSAHTYTTSATKQHPEGIELSNWFLRRIEDKDTGGEVVCAKTGYVTEAGNCAVSYGVDAKGRKYICVTADAPGSWKCIYDHVKIYKRFSKRK